jgi:FixJ family two-component response regulator
MQPTVLILHRSDTLLRAIVRLLVSEGYRVRTGESVDALLGDPGTSSPGLAVLMFDEDEVGPAWREQLARIPAGIPRVVLTWFPASAFPAGVTPVAKPFRARDLLDTLARELAARAHAGPDASR